MKNTGQVEDEYGGWGDDGYQDSLSATYGAVKSAPTIPSGPPSSMPPAPTPVAALEPAPVAAPVPTPEPVQPTVPAGPPLPETGLPEGWSMDQWNAYGNQWLEQYGK